MAAALSLSDLEVDFLFHFFKQEGQLVVHSWVGLVSPIYKSEGWIVGSQVGITGIVIVCSVFQQIETALGMVCQRWQWMLAAHSGAVWIPTGIVLGVFSLAFAPSFT